MKNSWKNIRSSRMSKLFLQKGKGRHRRAIGRGEGKTEKRSWRYYLQLSLFLIITPNCICSKRCSSLSTSHSTIPFCFLVSLYQIHVFKCTHTHAHPYTHTNTHSFGSFLCLFPAAQTWSGDKMARASCPTANSYMKSFKIRWTQLFTRRHWRLHLCF